MRRDINKAITEGEQLQAKRPGLAITISQLLAIRDRQDWNSKDSVINAISEAYAAGLAVGQRNA